MLAKKLCGHTSVTLNCGTAWKNWTEGGCLIFFPPLTSIAHVSLNQQGSQKHNQCKKHQAQTELFFFLRVKVSVSQIVLKSSSCVEIYSQWDLLIGAGCVQRVDPAVAVVVAAAVQLFAEFDRHFSVSEWHVFTVPDVQFTAKIKHQHLEDSRTLTTSDESVWHHSDTRACIKTPCAELRAPCVLFNLFSHMADCAIMLMHANHVLALPSSWESVRGHAL